MSKEGRYMLGVIDRAMVYADEGMAKQLEAMRAEVQEIYDIAYGVKDGRDEE